MPVQKSLRRQRLMLYCIQLKVISDFINFEEWMEYNIGVRYYDWDIQDSSHYYGNTTFSFRELEGKVKFILRWV